MYRRRLEKLDKKVVSLIESGKLKDLFLAERLYNSREEIITRQEILGGSFSKAPYSLSEIKKLQNLKKRSLPPVSFSFKSSLPFSDGLENHIKKTLSRVGYSFGQGDHLIKGHFKAEKKYFNVEGFEKYRFNLEIKSLNGKKQIDQLAMELDATGRTLKQATGKILEPVKQWIKEELYTLSLEL